MFSKENEKLVYAELSWLLFHPDQFCHLALFQDKNIFHNNEAKSLKMPTAICFQMVW